MVAVAEIRWRPIKAFFGKQIANLRVCPWTQMVLEGRALPILHTFPLAYFHGFHVRKASQDVLVEVVGDLRLG